MDNLLEALKTGSAFAVNRERKGNRRTPRAAGGGLHVILMCTFWCHGGIVRCHIAYNVVSVSQD